MKMRKIFLILFLIFVNVNLCSAATVDVPDAARLRQAVNAANNDTSQEYIININASNIIIESELAVSANANIRINGNGATITGSGTGIFRLTQGHVVFNQITFTGGNTSDSGGAVYIGGTAYAVFNNCTFFNNKAGNYGGAVYIDSNSNENNTIFTNCTIAGNSASSSNGGGVAVFKGGVSFTACIISGNGSGANADVFINGGSIITGDRKYNIIGNTNATNFNLNDRTNIQAQNIFLKNPLELETVKNAQILKLSPTSPARDSIPAGTPNILSVDECGTSRPQLELIDAGAFEALPVQALSVEITGSPYIQQGESEFYTVKVYPEDASRNANDDNYSGVELNVSDANIINIENSAQSQDVFKITATATGTAKLSARLNGWDASNNKINTSWSFIDIHIGSDELKAPVLSIDAIENLTLTVNRSASIKPEVSITINDFKANDWVDYKISSVTLNSPDVADCEIESSGKNIILTGKNAGSSDVNIAVTANNDAGTGSSSQNFTLTVSSVSNEDTSSKGSSKNSFGGGGGGCEAGFSGFSSWGDLTVAGFLILIYDLISRKKSK